jgi:uncharacterized membrane protein YhaH (DUF805 family)
MKTMLNPQGRIDPVTFRNAAMILIVVGAILSLVPLVLPALTVLSFVSVVLIYPWLVIWVKRFHDAGKSGAMFLVVLVLWLIASLAANVFITRRFASSATPVDPRNVMAGIAAQMRSTAIPGTIVSVAIALAFVLVGNALLRPDPELNAYGPAHKR